MLYRCSLVNMLTQGAQLPHSHFQFSNFPSLLSFPPFFLFLSRLPFFHVFLVLLFLHICLKSPCLFFFSFLFLFHYFFLSPPGDGHSWAMGSRSTSQRASLRKQLLSLIFPPPSPILGRAAWTQSKPSAVGSRQGSSCRMNALEESQGEQVAVKGHVHMSFFTTNLLL